MLEDHLRQYRHNNSDEFVFAYDKEGIDSLFKEFIRSRQQMLAEIRDLEKNNRELEDLLQKYQDKYFNLKYGAHK